MSHRRPRALKGLSLLLGASLVIAACGGDDDETPSGAAQESTETTTATSEGGEDTGAPAGGTYTFAAEQEPESLNFTHATYNTAWGQYIMTHVWPYVVMPAPDGSALNNEDLATYEVTSEDPQVITYTINPEATWSDGTPISADDFIYTWTAQNGAPGTETDPDTGEPLPLYNAAATNGYDVIESVEGSEDGKTVTVTFSEPYADWEFLFGPLLPAHAFAAEGGGDPVVGYNEGFLTTALSLDNVVSGGPYQVSDYQTGVSVTLSRNDQYWGEPAQFDTIVFPFITDAAQQPAAFANGEADGGFPQAQIDLLDQIRNLDGIEHEVGFGSFWEHMDFNAANPLLAELEVRQAIAKGLNRQEIVDTLPGAFSEDAEVLNNRMYFPGSPHYVPNGEAEYGTQDIAAARALMEGAGFTEGGDGIYARDGQRASFRLVWRDPNPRRQQTAELVKSQLAEAGIDIVLDPKPDFTFLDNGDFDIALFGWTGSSTLGANESIYVPGGGQNYGGVSDPEIQTLFSQANVELDEETRAELMNQIDEKVWEVLTNVPLFQVPEIIIWREGTEGVQYNGYQGPTWNAPTWTLR